LNRSCGSRPIIKSAFVQFVWNENLRSAWSPEGWRQRELGRVPDAQILFPQTLKWANGAGPSRHFASQPKRSMRPRRSLHAFDSQEICQQREEHLPCLGGVGRRTHDLCRERKRRHREALRPHFGAGGLGTFFPEYRFYSYHLPSGQEGGAVAVNVRARLPSPGPFSVVGLLLAPLRRRSLAKSASCLIALVTPPFCFALLQPAYDLDHRCCR